MEQSDTLTLGTLDTLAHFSHLTIIAVNITGRSKSKQGILGRDFSENYNTGWN